MESSSYQIGNAPETASHEDAHGNERLREEPRRVPEGAQGQKGQGFPRQRSAVRETRSRSTRGGYDLQRVDFQLHIGIS